MEKQYTNPIIIIKTFVFAFLFFLAGAILGDFIRKIPTGDNEFFSTALYYARFISTWIVFLLAMLVNKNNHSFFMQLTTATEGNNWKMIGIGIALGFGMNAICILGAWLNKDIYLSYIGFPLWQLFVLYLCIFIQSSAEELMCRVYIFQKIQQAYPAIVAILVNSLFFTFIHIVNKGITFLALLNIFLFGFAYSLIVHFFKSPWCVMFAHATWNFSQSIIFGLPNSGIVLPCSVFHLDASNARDSFAYSAAVGVEGTILACIVVLATIFAIYFLHKRMHPQESNS